MVEFFRWLDGHPVAYWAAAGTATAALATAAFATPRARASSTAIPPKVRTWLFPLLLFLALLAWRWPTMLCADELNTDESQFIAGALTLQHDPVFWRSVDGMTAGPLVYYSLLLLKLAGPPLDYFTARLFALVLLWASLWLIYRLLRQNYGEWAGRLGVLPGTLLIASVTALDLQQFSSEIVSLPIVALVLTLVSGDLAAFSRRRAALAGLLAGLLPWAKLQAAPIGAVLIVAGLVRLAQAAKLDRREKCLRAAALTGGTLVPAVVFAIVTWQAGVWSIFFDCYILHNLYYSNLAARTGTWAEYFLNDSSIYGVLGCLGLSVAVAIAGLSRWREARPVFRLGAPLALAALFCIIYPGRAFLHYAFLLVVPVVAWTGAAVGELCRDDRWKTRAGLVAILGAELAVLLGFRALAPIPIMIGQLAEHWQRPRSVAGNIIALIARPGERLAVWGWYAEAFVMNHLTQGTRSAYSVWSITDNPRRAAYRRIFLEDFVRNRPEVFADSVGANSIFFHDRLQDAHETFPALAEVVRRDYALVQDLGYLRIYARRDLMASRRITMTAVRDAIVNGRQFTWVQHSIAPENLGRIFGTHFYADERFNGLLLLPPREVIWKLHGDEREIYFDCGYYPTALQQAEGDGTEFVIELAAADGSRRTLRSFVIDPAHRPADRAPRTIHVPLPPYGPESRFIIRTTPGHDNYDAWDWAYISNVKFVRSPEFTFRQFPGFNRMPSFAVAPLAGILTEPKDPTLLLHAPSEFEYCLRGGERRLEMTFGFLDRTVNIPEGTDGATFSVQLINPAGSAATLATRNLQPTRSAADRGPQIWRIELPPVVSGTKLKVLIDPNGSNAYDWTYVSELQLY
ncbi:MAG: hypothetical protein HYV96_17305 [Opitutae bacterium]|nr:hypothetical protein [Opitutae bacterium]